MRLRDIIRGNFLPLLAMLILLVIFFGKFLLGETRFLYGFNDFYLFNYPFAVFLKNSIISGEFPLWNPYILSGSPVSFSLLSTFCLSIFLFPLSFIPDINMFIILSIALFGMYVFLMESVQVNRTAAVIGSIAFTFSGFFMTWLHQEYTVGSIVFLPWNLYLLDKALSRKSTPFAIAAGISVSLSLMNGASQMFIYNLMALTAVFIFRTLPLLKQGRKEALTSSFLFFLILGIGFCLSGIYVFHYLELLQLSHRPEFTYARVTGTEDAWGAVPLKYLVTYIMPDFFGSPIDKNLIRGAYGEKISYLGVLPFMLAVIALFSEKNRYTYLFFGLAVFSLLMALGSPLYALFYYAVPILAKARSLGRINILINFSIAVLAAIGVHNLMEGKINKKTILLICWGFMFTFAAGCLIFFDKIVEKPKYQFLLQFVVWVNALSAIAFYGLKYVPTQNGGTSRSGRYFPYLCVGALFLVSAITVYCDLFLNMAVWKDYTLEGSSRYAWKTATFLKEGGLSLWSSKWNMLYVHLAVGAIIMILYFLFKTGEMSRKILIIVFISLTAIDLMGYGMKLNPYYDRDVRMLSKTPGISFLKRDNELYRILPFEGDIMPGNTPLLYGLQDVAGYEAVYPKWYHRLITEVELRTPIDSPLSADAIPDKGFGNIVEISNTNSVILDMLNVKYVVTEKKLDAPGWPEDYYNYIRNLIPVYYGDDFLIYKNKNYMQRVFLVPEVKVENDGEKVIKELFSNTFDPRRYAIVETNKDSIYSFPPSDPVLLKESSLTLEGYKNNSVSLKAEMKDQGFLVLADNYYPGWKVFVDGKEQTLYKTNYSLRGVHLEKGQHLIKFVYDPLSFKIGMYLSLSTLLLIASYFVWYGFSKKIRQHQRLL